METSGGSVVQEMRCGAYQIHTRVVKYLIQSRYIADWKVHMINQTFSSDTLTMEKLLLS